ncbi:hypothetical protein [Candidatus Paracaedibacter symbiosus]|uniref:hypothetical protein n=1 Tax=Candidatus Paracaedibacter symbiosus TaxID=244582 RepID=UPI0018DC1470|nr:hypothetical protein [Candidatus Paracaedibacter symbiosus]
MGHSRYKTVAWHLATGAFVGDSGTGTMTIDGPGSTLTTSDTTTMGNNSGSNGTLTVQNGGIVTSGTTTVGANSGSNGTINIGAPASQLAVSPGTIARNILFGAGTGILNFNHTDNNYTFSNVVSGPGAVNILNGTTIFTNNNPYSGQTSIQGGTLTAAASSSIAASAGIQLTAGTFFQLVTKQSKTSVALVALLTLTPLRSQREQVIPQLMLVRL